MMRSGTPRSAHERLMDEVKRRGGTIGFVYWPSPLGFAASIPTAYAEQLRKRPEVESITLDNGNDDVSATVSSNNQYHHGGGKQQPQPGALAVNGCSSALVRAQDEASAARVAVQRAQQRAASQHRPSRGGPRLPLPLWGRDSGDITRDCEQAFVPASPKEEMALLPADALTGSSLCAHMHPPWTERISWFVGPRERPYSRRELTMDALVHGVGLLLALAGCVALAERVRISQPPVVIVVSVALYGLSLVTMLALSSVFNVGQHRWARHRLRLNSLDHAGICLMIVGTYTPLMAVACSYSELSVVWAIGAFSVCAKSHRGRLDVLPLHVACFLLMGWSCLAVWSKVTSAFSPWGVHLIISGGVLYTAGLIPWALKPLEFHLPTWHAFVIVASACFFALVYGEIAILPEVTCPASGGSATLSGTPM